MTSLEAKMSADINHTQEELAPIEQYSPNVPTVAVGNTTGILPLRNNILEEDEYIPGMVRETTVWNVYNNEARKVDTELVKDWKDSLNFLLVFAAIFAAVLTAFIIESKKLLEQDPTELLVDIVVLYLSSGGNYSTIPTERPPFNPSSSAISINSLLFASLGASLVAALASVIALQWVNEYDAAITRGGSSPEDRAMRRQFRFAGATAWNMGELIAALPLLLYSSVALFWIGAILWIWTINTTVGYIVAGGAVLAFLFYASTTLIAAICVSAPFHTPISRGIYWLFKPAITSILQLVNIILRRCTPQSVVVLLRRTATILRSQLRCGITHLRFNRVMSLFKKYILPHSTAIQREDLAAAGHPRLKEYALCWLATQLPVSADAHVRAEMLIREVLNCSMTQRIPPKFPNAPWPAILGTLAWPYLQRIIAGTLSEKDYDGLFVLLRCIKLPAIWAIVSRAARYEWDPQNHIYWDQNRFNKDDFLLKPSEKATKIALLLVRDVPIPSNGGTHEIEATIRLIKWRNLRNIGGIHPWKEVFQHIDQCSPQYRKACLDNYRRIVGCWKSIPEDLDGKPEDHDAIISNLVQTSHSRPLPSQELFALVQAFEAWVTKSFTGFSDRLSPENIIRKPLLYGLHLCDKRQWKEIHWEITLSVARAAESIPKAEQESWVWSIIMMVWIGYSGTDWDKLIKEHGENIGMRDLWPSVAMSWSRETPSISHIVEIIQILGRLLQKGQETGPIWLFGDEKKKHNNLAQAIEVFDNIVIQNCEIDLHLAVIQLLRIEITHLDHLFLSNQTSQEDQAEQLSNIRDPCLAIVGTYACKILSPVEIEVTDGYIKEHAFVLGVVKEILYQRPDPGDPEAIWLFRARLWSVGSASSTRKLVTSAMHKPEQLSFLQLIFQHPVSCPDHSDGPHHILFHLFEAFPPSIRLPEGTMALGGVDLAKETLNPILALLALASGWTPLLVIFEASFNQECVGRVKKIGDTIKRDPVHIFALLTDIISAHVDIVSRPQQAACVLELVKRVPPVLLDDAPVIAMHQMDRALRKLVLEMFHKRKGTSKDREMVVAEAKRLCSLLQGKASERLISSSSHLKLLSCARASALTCIPPGLGWLRMYDMT